MQGKTLIPLVGPSSIYLGYFEGYAMQGKALILLVGHQVVSTFNTNKTHVVYGVGEFHRVSMVWVDSYPL